MNNSYSMGVAYYPEHWDESEWKTDFELMNELGINFVRVGEFAWGRMEPEEGRFEFDWLDRTNALARSHGIKLLLCTPTEAPPPWLWHNHPDILPVDINGLIMGANSRRHCCANSDTFLAYSDRITRAMAEHFAHDDNVFGWQLDNEIGAHTHFTCTCDACQRKFRLWLRDRYGDVDTLNREWGLVFWSGEVRSFEEIAIHQNPISLSNPGYKLDVLRFGGDSWTNLLRRQAEIIRTVARGRPITHNVTWYAEQLDMFKLNEFLDVIGIDIYQQRPELVSMIDDLFYGIGKRPFWVMEMGASASLRPGASGPVMAVNRPVATVIKHMLKGASATSFFRWRQSPSGGEMEGQSHLRRHDGSVTPVYESLRASRKLIRKVADHMSPRRERSFDAAIVLDYTDHLQLHSSPSKRNIDYFHDALSWHRSLNRYGLRCTFIHKFEDLSAYPLVIAHEKWSMDQRVAANFRSYVREGGLLIAADRFGTHTPNNRMVLEPLPGYLDDVFGIRLAEYQEIREDLRLAIRLCTELGGHVLPLKRSYARLELEGAQMAGAFDTGELGGKGALSINTFGRGKAVFVGGLLGSEEVSVLLSELLPYLGIERRMWVREELPGTAEIIAEGEVMAMFNHSGDPLTLTPRQPMRNFATNEPARVIEVPPYDVQLLYVERPDS